MFDYAKYMEMALEQADIAFEQDEVPVGAVIISEQGEVLAKAKNIIESTNDVTNHAEIVAIKEASKITAKDGNKRLEGCSLFVTLEPCAMCAQAISLARISKLIYGAADEKGGAVENGVRLFNSPTCHHKPEIISGIMENDCSQILKQYFAGKRRE